jgi:hypothetical protein
MVKLRFYYIYIYLVLVRMNIIEVQTAVCVWYYSIEEALCLSTNFEGKEAKAGFIVFVLISLSIFIQRWLNSVMIRHSIDFNKTEATTNLHNSSAFIIRKATVRVIPKTVGVKMGTS